MSLKWWEKTVEYKFVMLVAKQKKLFLAPLDDKQERAGDLVFGSDSKWLLIEFKKDSNSINTEKKKFNDYQAANEALSSKDKHHHIVYGKEVDNLLNLFCQTYFSSSYDSLSGMLASGAEFDLFKSYIEEFTAFKKSPKGTSGSGGLNIDEFSMVAGVNNKGDIVECMSLREFKQEYKLELVQEKVKSHDMDHSR